ncbi:conserved hypothetical protein [Culex quinquefasciatus]|uniref:DUF753 domain-containing protein n=1 Tax=Culex quinquefasciatus TaxID=7176 RepID=B0WDA1_CULQU|nr:conserved hypothetical protein [Culex quinquefasciatus]|eukprot:XP_001846669.1 conserved hypothetical protein [Culex quinquefasciatus]
MQWKIVLLIVVMGALVENLAIVEGISCYKCSNCVKLPENVDTVDSEPCETSCAIWKNSADEIERGCKPVNPEVELKHECTDDLCNVAIIPICKQCSENLDDCKTVFCKINDDDDDDDESRGCVSDLEDGYNEDDYLFCSTENCNREVTCVKCNSAENPDCLENWEIYANQRCPNGEVIYEKGCFRENVDATDFRLGCTSELIDPEAMETSIFKKCAGDNCNEKGNPKSWFRDCTDFLNNVDEVGFDFYDVCNETLCNNQTFPSHLQCYQCTDNCDDLTDAELDFCPATEAQYCFTLRTDGGELIHGCDQDARADECQERKNCLTCESGGCNGADPEPVQCVTCDSTEDCKATGNELKDCDFFEECFLDYGTGELAKGCSSELNWCDTETCKDCSGSRCNEHHCVRCSSETLEDCISGKGNVGYELCSAEEKCVAFVDEQGFTVRGCKASFPELDCTDESCNEYDGPGSNDELFPANAMQCHHCTGLDCNIGSTTTKYCPSNNNLGCFSMFDGDKITDRGCVTEDMKCEDDPNCFGCTGRPNCNDQEPRECKACTFANAEDDCLEDPEQTCKTMTGCVAFIDDDNTIVRNCAQNVPKCRDGSCVLRSTNDQDVCSDGEGSWKVCDSNQAEDKCWRYQREGEVRTGCSEDRDEICGAESEHCKACSSILCNEQAIAECSCSDCGQQSTKLCEDPNSKCYAGIKDGLIIMGCSEDLESEDGVTTCEGVLCNSAWSCHSCSTQDGEDCLYDTERSCGTVLGCVTLLDGSNVIRGCAEDLCVEGCADVCNTEFCNNQQVCYACEDCETVNDQPLKMCQQQGCYSAHDLDERTISRGCADEATDEQCQPGVNCIECEGTMCNVDEPLQVSLQCSQCDLGSCVDYAPAQSCDSVGLLIDRCVKFAPLGVTIYRGCLSGIADAVKDVCKVQSEFCTYCDEDYCNTEELSCHRCSTDKESFGCLLNPTTSTECNRGDSCTTCLDTDGHLHRGCTSNLAGTCSSRPAQNVQCQHPDCNSVILPADRYECYQCQNCLQVEQSDRKPCLQYKDSESCYVQAVDELTVHRGCTSDVPEPCANCLQCSDENGCNSMGPLQRNELSCVKCTSNTECEGRAFGSRCEEDVLIGRTDSCYTQFVGEFVIQKGCLSDLAESNPFYDDCQRSSGNCATCTTNDCNKGKAWCYKCNSVDDPDCSDSANLTSYRAECEAECVAKLDDEGFTVRGCIEDFVAFDRVSCEASDLCEVCEGKNCNTATLPADDYLSCYRCEGSDSNCLEATMEAMMKACRRHVQDDQCYTFAENATWITRGCLSDLSEPCVEPCLACANNGCNRESVLQQNSLVCVTCEGAACTGAKEGRRCTERVLLGRQDSCYEYDDGEIVRKGCLSDLVKGDEAVKESCESEDSESCKLCDYNNCNGEHHYCVSCDASEDPECAGRMSPVLAALLEDCDESRCVSKFEGSNTVIKGCASAFEPCQKGDPNCSECEGSLCNNVPFPADRILCHQCTACNIPTTEAAICARYDPAESCYTRLIGGIIQRGCLSEASQQECDDQCFTCTSNGCNNEPSRYPSELSCVHCQGGSQCSGVTPNQSERCMGSVALGETDKCYTLSSNGEVLERGCLAKQQNSCGQLAGCEEDTCACDNCNLADRERQYTCNKCEGKDCGQAVSVVGGTCTGAACVSYVSRDGLVSRGCLQDYESLCSIYGNRHSLCFGNRCNGEVYPVGRMTCYQCEDCTSTDQQQSRICQRYVQQDGCYTWTDGSSVNRGCLSDLPQLNCSGNNCVSCSKPDCNRQDSTTTTENPTPSTTTQEAVTTEDPETSTEVPLQSCIICSESDTDSSCAWGFKPSAATACPPLNEAEFGCFRCRKDSLAVRGCAANLDQTTCDDGTITDCDTTGCNGESFFRQQCAVCTRDCDGSRASFTVQLCPGNVEYESRGCYLLRNARRVVTERGCFAELSEEQRADCLRDGDDCWRCTGDGCNGGAAMRAFWVGILGALALALVRAW